MTHDPVSAVASWLTPTETPTAGDPLPAAAEASTTAENDLVVAPIKSTRLLFEEPMTEAERRLDATLDRLAAMVDQRRDAAQRMLADESLTASPPEDPVLALIAEDEQLGALWAAASDRGDEIFDTLPDDVRKGRVRVSFSGELGRCISDIKNCYTSEGGLQSFLDIWRRGWRRRAESDGKSPEAAVAEFNREVGLDQALAQLRAGQAEIKATREASGCEAHYREAEDLVRRAAEVENQIRNTKPVTLTGAIAMLKWGRENGCCDEDDEDEHLLTNRVIAGLRDMQPEASRISPGEKQPAKRAVIGFGEPEEGGAA